MGNFFVESLADRLLQAIADGYDVLYYAHRRPGELLSCGLNGLRSLEAERARARVVHELARLKRKRLIEVHRKNDARAFALTKLGREVLGKQKPAFPQKLPENQKLLVSFDIPETHRGERLMLRRYLRSLGFVRRHDSLWEAEHDWSAFLFQRLEGSALRDWICVYIGTEIEKTGKHDPAGSCLPVFSGSIAVPMVH